MSLKIANANMAYDKARMLDKSSNPISSMNDGIDSFKKMLANNVNSTSSLAVVNDNIVKSEKKDRLQSFISGNISNISNSIKEAENVSTEAIVDQANPADLISSLTQAEIVLQNIITIRDKIISAYNDIIKMQI